MPKHHRINLYWSGRTDSVPVMAGQIAGFFRAISALHPKLSGFLFQEKGTHVAATIDSPAACEQALRKSTVVWNTGEAERTSYTPRFFLLRRIEPPVAVTVTCGIEPLGLGPIFTPNRLEFLMRTDIGDERASREVLEGVMRSAVGAFKPDFGFAGSDSAPDAPMAVFSEGRPPVGWMTYLRAGYPEIPRTLPQPAVAYPIGTLGTLIVAHPELFHDTDPAQRAAMERVRALLDEAGVLIPASELPPAV